MAKASRPLTLASLKPSPDNPRTIDPEALAGLKVSLSEFGDLSGLVFNARTGVLVAGHQRLKALTEQHGRRLKLTGGSVVTPDGEAFPVRVVDWPPEKAQAAMVVANSPHIAGDWTSGLGALLAGLEDSLGAMFEGLRLDDLRVDVPEAEPGEGLTDPDAVPDVPVEPVTKRGDLWLCGEHRVLCGDSTCAADVARLMGGEKAALCLTDPPYGCGYRLATWKDNDNKANENLVRAAYSLAPQARVWTPGKMNLSRELRREPTAKILCWTKGFSPAGNGLGGASTWEPILVIDPPNKALKNDHLHHATYKDADVVGKHPDPKPVSLWRELMESFTASGMIVYDPFLGSGTTVIAAEQLGRRAFGIEIEPRYVDVAITRYAAFTGKHPVLESTGQTLDAVKQAAGRPAKKGKANG